MKPIKSSGMPLFLMLLGLTIFTDIITRLREATECDHSHDMGNR